MIGLSAEDISCERNSRLLFQHISFQLSAGELLQVVGNNGVGKSSLLRIASGLLQPHTGKIMRNEESIFYLGHALALRDELTIKENIIYFENAVSDTDLKNALTRWKLSDLVDRPCGELSQGQKQRFALARVSLSEKKCWILDEPFSNLDNEGIFQCEQLLQTHLNRGGMILLSTHREIKINEVSHTVLELRDIQR